MEVEAELLPTIAPHLANVATFALHYSAPGDGHWWIVSNVETGLMVSYASRRAYAVSAARAKLLNKTPEDTVSAYRKARRKYPLLKAA
jgi:hypothetical protein